MKLKSEKDRAKQPSKVRQELLDTAVIHESQMLDKDVINKDAPSPSPAKSPDEKMSVKRAVQANRKL